MNKQKTLKKPEVCAYKQCCYLAEALECFGYKTDCVLYQKSNKGFYTRKRFDEAVDRLINKAKTKYGSLHSEVSDSPGR